MAPSSQAAVAATPNVDRSYNRFGDEVFFHASRGAAIVVLALLAGIIVSLIWAAWPSISTFGIGFLIGPALSGFLSKYGYIYPILVAAALAGVAFALFVIAVAAAEVGIGLAIVILIYRNRETINVDEVNLLRW